MSEIEVEEGSDFKHGLYYGFIVGICAGALFTVIVL
jgi:hypothetical protein